MQLNCHENVRLCIVYKINLNASSFGEGSDQASSSSNVFVTTNECSSENKKKVVKSSSH
jgi:hypothetical protein